eukprot:scaffold1402_cov254-Pinguiococcus_pyrenoidosus.AAC.42
MNVSLPRLVACRRCEADKQNGDGVKADRAIAGQSGAVEKTRDGWRNGQFVNSFEGLSIDVPHWQHTLEATTRPAGRPCQDLQRSKSPNAQHRAARRVTNPAASPPPPPPSV